MILQLLSKAAKLSLAAVLLPLLGCGSSGTTGSGSGIVPGPAPHGGQMFALPGDKGFVEILTDYERIGARKKPGSQSQIVVYFLSPDQTSALSPAPTSVTATIITPEEGEATTVTLKPQPASDKDPLSAGRFVSDLGKFDYDEIRGELTITLDGDTIKQSFSFR